MKGNEIIVSAEPKGTFLEGLISGALKPGVVMEIKTSTEPVNGRFTWEAWSPGNGDGEPSLIAVLLPDHYRGLTYADAYTSGDRCFLYCPLPGEELNLRKADISGTGSGTEDLSIGEKLLVVDGTGYISPVAVGVAHAKAVYPFFSLETVTDQAAETLVHCMYTGSN